MSTSVKPAPKAVGVPFKVGDDPRRNLTKAGPGRPPDWLKKFCDDLLASPGCMSAVEAIMGDKKHPAFATMWGKVADRAHGKPVESKEVKAEITHRVIVEVQGE